MQTAGCAAHGRTGRPSTAGVLEDYANLAEGLLAALPGHLRRALVRCRARARRRDPRALRGPAGWLLRHGRRSRGADRPAQEPPGQRRSVGQRDGRHGLAEARRVHRRGALLGCGRARHWRRSLRTPTATRPRSRSGSARSQPTSSAPPRSRSAAIRRRQRHEASARRGALRVPAVHRPCRGPFRDERHPAVARSPDARRRADGVRLPRLRLPRPDHRSGRTRCSVSIGRVTHARARRRCRRASRAARRRPGLAHAELEESDPADGATITTPYTLTATFSEEFDPDRSFIRVRGPAGDDRGRGRSGARTTRR